MPQQSEHQKQCFRSPHLVDGSGKANAQKTRGVRVGKRKYTIVTDFSGMETLGMAFDALDYDYVILSTSETNTIARRFVEINFKPKESRNCAEICPMDQCKDCDLYGAGFPYQDDSPYGLKTGPQSHRGQAYQLCVQRIKWLKPKRLILENVPAFGTYDNGNLLRELRKELQADGYKVQCKVLDAIHFHVPQTRKRLFIVGIRLDMDPDGFRFPTGTGTTNLDTILDPPCAADNAERLPNGIVAARHVKN